MFSTKKKPVTRGNFASLTGQQLNNAPVVPVPQLQKKLQAVKWMGKKKKMDAC